MWTRLALLVALLTVPVCAKPTADELCRQAAALVGQHKIQPGVKKYFEALRLDPRCAKAHAGLGELYYQVCQSSSAKTPPDPFTETAILALTRAIQLDPKDDKSLFYRGDLYVNLRKYPQALKDLNRSLVLNPDSLASMSRAVCYSGLHQDKKAVADYTTTYRKTGNVICLYSRGNCYLRLRLYEEAMADYERVVKDCNEPETVALASRELKQMKRLIGELPVAQSSSNQAQELFDRARDVKNTGHPKESIPLFDQALAIDPNFAKAAIFKGDAYFMLDDLDHAIQCYRRGLQLDPKDKQGQRFLGDALEKKYDRTKNRKLLEEAIGCYEAAVRLDPTYGFAKENLLHAKERLRKLP